MQKSKKLPPIAHKQTRSLSTGEKGKKIISLFSINFPMLPEKIVSIVGIRIEINEEK